MCDERLRITIAVYYLNNRKICLGKGNMYTRKLLKIKLSVYSLIIETKQSPLHQRVDHVMIRISSQYIFINDSLISGLSDDDKIARGQSTKGLEVPRTREKQY